MANIVLLDTGYPNITDSGDQESTANRANSGSAINLKSVELNYSRGAGLDTGPTIARYYSDYTTNLAPTQVNFGSVENPKITISGVIDRTDTTDMDLIAQLDRLVTTKGIKLLYYNNTTDGYRDLTDSLGTDNSNDVHKTNNFSGTSTPHLHVRISSFQIRHTSGGSSLRYTLVCEVTA